MPYVGVLFEILKAETLPGEKIRVAGANPELGAWDPRGVTDMPTSEADLLLLKTGSLRYPNWSMSAPAWIKFGEEVEEESEELKQAPEGSLDSDGLSTTDSLDSDTLDKTPEAVLGDGKTMDIRYKFVKDMRQLGGGGLDGFQWESKISNRRVALPLQPGSIWLVSSQSWDSDEPARVMRIAQADVYKICMTLDPDYMSGRNRQKGSYVLSPTTARSRTEGSATPTARSPQHRQRSKGSSYAIEHEFDFLSAKEVPALLVDKNAAEKTANDMVEEVALLQREMAVLRSEKELAEAAMRATREENTELRQAAESAAHVSVDDQSGEVRSLREENAELRAQNAQLLAELEAMRLQLGGLLGAERVVEEHSSSSTSPQALDDSEGQQVGGDEDLQQQRRRSCPPDLQSVAVASGTMLSSRSTSSLDCAAASGGRPRWCRGVSADSDFTASGGRPRWCRGASADSDYAVSDGRPSWCRGVSTDTDFPDETAPKQGSKLPNELLMKARGSLSAAPQIGKTECPEDETELKKALRKRRERIETNMQDKVER